MSPEEQKLRREVPSVALDRLRERFPKDVLEVVYYADQVTVVVPAARIAELLAFLRDDEVTAFFSPHAAGQAVMFLMAIGKRARG